MRRLSIVLLSAWLTSTAGAVESSSSNLLTIDDLLAAEELDEASFSPDGSQIAFTRTGPIGGSISGGFDEASLARGRVFIAPREDGAAREIQGRPGARYRLAPSRVWSPDGQGVLLLETSNGIFGLAYWDRQTGAVRSLAGRPSSSFAVFDWLNQRLAYAVLPGERSQEGASMQMLERLERKWRAAWTASEPQVTVSSINPVFAETAVPAGGLMLANLADGSSTQIAEGDYVSLVASPDGQRLAAIRAAESIPDAFSPFGRRGELQVFRITASGARRTQTLTALDVEPSAVVWSPSGDRLLVAAKVSGETERETQLIEIDVATGKQRNLPLPTAGSLIAAGVVPGSRVLPIGWIGKWPAAVIASKAADVIAPPSVGAHLDYGDAENRRLDVYSFARDGTRNLTAFTQASVDSFLAPAGAAFALIVADGALWRIDTSSAPRRLTPSEGPTVRAFGVGRRYPSPPLPSAYVRVSGTERVALYVTSDKGAPVRRVFDVRAGSFGSALSGRDFVSASPDLSAAVTRNLDGWTTRLVLHDGSTRTLATANAALNAKAKAPLERFEYTSGSDDLIGWVVLPPGATSGKPLPAIVCVYGGTVYGEEAPTFAAPYFAYPVFSGQLLAMQGFAVVYPGTPLGSGETTDVMTALADHAVAAIDALASRGIIDPQRVGVMGQSFGGFSTAAILARRSERFRAGIAMAGVYDWLYGYGLKSQAQLLGEDPRGAVLEAQIVESGQIRLGKPFWQDPAPYIRNSPIFEVERIDSPLLILQGDLDLGVTGLGAAQRMYYALVRAGKKPALVRYWGEGHVAQSEWAVRDQWSRITKWFDAYLHQPSAAIAPR